MSFKDCLFGPKLFVEYGTNEAKTYQPNHMEALGDQILTVMALLKSVGLYLLPLPIYMLYTRGALVPENLPLFIKISLSVFMLMLSALILRCFGRMNSPEYTNFMNAYKESPEFSFNRERLKNYDYQFRYFSVDFEAATVRQRQPTNVKLRVPPFNMLAFPIELIAYFSMHSFGIRLMYPGSIKALQRYLRPVLINGRTKLVQKSGAVRHKILTYDRNEIDTIFVDNRREHHRGKTLVICCEGNAGFYEVGILSTPLAKNYSVIGWNHPGFEGSTGTPYPSQERNAIESVIAFSIKVLKFHEEDIILYGWSIGGYTAFWGACCYPNVRGIILDATFDDVYQLANVRTPRIFRKIVETGIRRYCNLDNTAMVPGYDGPILMIRRLRDEIIAEEDKLETNRGNNLILAILRYRYPLIFDEAECERIQNVLIKPLANSGITQYNEAAQISKLTTHVSTNGKTFPMYIGEGYDDTEKSQMANFLLTQHFEDFYSSHCTPLPEQYFRFPWNIPVNETTSPSRKF